MDPHQSPPSKEVQEHASENGYHQSESPGVIKNDENAPPLGQNSDAPDINEDINQDVNHDINHDAENAFVPSMNVEQVIEDNNQVPKPTNTTIHADGVQEESGSDSKDPDSRNQDPDPNTSALSVNMPVSSNKQYATPSKSLPPLKDIEHITTPKSFDVAKDVVKPMRSSPIDTRTNSQFPDFAEAGEDAFDATANDTFGEPALRSPGKHEQATLSADIEAAASFLGVDPAVVLKNGQEFISKVSQRAHSYHGLQSELSFFKLNQEQINQVQQKKYDKLQQEIERLSAVNDSMRAENDTISNTSLAQESELIKLHAKLKNATEKLKQLETSNESSEKSSFSAMDAKIQEIQALNDTINQLTKSNIDQGMKLSAITKELNEATNDKFSAKLDLSKVNNELIYLKGQKEWYETQLKSIQGKYTDLIKRHDTEYYRDANKISSLTSQNETLKSLKESLTQQVNELQSKVDSFHASLSEAESKLESRSLKFSKECANKDDTIELLNVQLAEKDDRILQLEEYAEEMKATTAETLSVVQQDNSSKAERIIFLEEKLRRTEEALDSELHRETELPKLAPSAEMILQEGNSGISLSTLYTEFNHIKKELVLEKSQKEKLAAQLQHFVSELESKKPAIANYRNQIQFYENSMKELLENMETIRIDKVETEKEANRLRARLASNEIELHSLKQLSRDLGMQLCFYLIHSKIRDDNEDPLSAQEKKVIDKILAKSGYKDNAHESDTDRLISERLIGFANIIELQKKNEELTVAVRSLGKQLEEKDLDSNGFEAAAVEEAREAILTLQGELDSLNLKYEAVSKERDLLKSLNGGNSQLESQQPELKTLRDANADLLKRVQDHESAVKQLQSQSEERIKKLNEKISELNSEKETFKLKVASTKYSVELAQNRLETTKKLLDNSQEELELSRKETVFWKEQSTKQEEILVKKSNELRDAERELFNHISSSKNLSTEKEVLKSLNSTLRTEIETLRKDKDQIGQFASSLQSILKEREASSSDLSSRLAQSVSNYQSLQEKIEQKEEKISILTSQSEMAMKAQNAKLEQVNELSQKLLEARSKLAEKEALVESLRSKGNSQQSGFSESRNLAHPTSGEDTQVPLSEHDDLRNALREAERQVAEFNNIAKSAEESLMKATESFDKYKVTTDEKLAALNNEKVQLNNLIKDYKEQIEQLNTELMQTKENYDAQVQELKLKVEENSYKANSYDSLKADYESKLDSISSDLKNQVAITDETQRRYKEKFSEADLLNKQVVKQKEDAEGLQKQIDELCASLKQKDLELLAKEESLSEQSSNVQDELSATQIKLRDLEYQYALAISQLEIRSSMAEGDDGSSSEEMRQVISFLRSEKESAEAKCTAMADQLEQSKVEAENLGAELNVMKLQVSRMQSMKTELNDSNKEHERLLEQLDQLNILRESNTTLRNENKNLSERMGQLQAELEALSKKQNEDAPDAGIDMEVQAQELNLLKEENDRIKAQLNNNQELKNLMQRFESLKSEFKTKLGVHRTKNRELEKELADLKSAQEKSQTASKEETGKLQEIQTLKAQLQESDKKFNEQITNLRASFETEKRTLETNYKAQLKDALTGKEPGTKASEEEIKQKLSQEFETKLAKHKQELDATFSKELEAKVQAKLNERLKSDTNKTPDDVDKIKEGLKQEYEQKIKDLNASFDKTLAEEKASVEKAVDKKYEFKLRVLNRKVERLESDKNKSSDSSTQPDQSKPHTSEGLSNLVKTGLVAQKTEGFQATNENISTNNQKKRPAASSAPTPVNFKRNKE